MGQDLDVERVGEVSGVNNRCLGRVKRVKCILLRESGCSRAAPRLRKLPGTRF